jgi:hypothetical protein
MPKKQRDYKAEYARRIARGKAIGLSVSQARGHARTHEAPVSKIKPPTFDRRLEPGVREIRRGKPVTKAAKAIAVSPERLRRYVKQIGVAKKVGRKWKIGPDHRKRRVEIWSAGQSHKIVVSSFADASLVGRYRAAVRRFLEDPEDQSHLDPFIAQSVRAVDGHRYFFEVRPNVLFRLDASETEPYEEVYEIVT